MGEETVFDRVARVLREQIGKDVEIKPETTFSDLNFDSLDLVENTLLLEAEFGLELHEDEIGGFTTVAELVAYVEGRING